MAYSLRFSLVTTKNTKHSRISLLTPQTNFLHAPADLRLPCNNQLSGLIAEKGFSEGTHRYQLEPANGRRCDNLFIQQSQPLAAIANPFWIIK